MRICKASRFLLERSGYVPIRNVNNIAYPGAVLIKTSISSLILLKLNSQVRLGRHVQTSRQMSANRQTALKEINYAIIATQK